MVLALILAIPLVAGELLARKLIGDAVASAVRTQIGGPAKVGFGSTPVLLQPRSRHASTHVTERHAAARGLRRAADGGAQRDAGATLHMKRLTSLEGAIGSLSVEARLQPSPPLAGLLMTPGVRRLAPAARARCR